MIGTRTPPANIPTAGLPANQREVRYAKVKCPKCGSKTLDLIEIWQNTITWRATDGWLDRQSGAMGDGFPQKVEGRCGLCNHGWTVRSASQIDDTLEEDEY